MTTDPLVWAVVVCGAALEFTDGGPVENDVHFCPNCGKKLVIAEKGGEG